MRKWLFYLFMLLFLDQALANESILPLRKILNSQAKHLATLDQDPRTEGCEARYRRLWRDGTLEIDWFYGYLDSDGVVSDRLYSQETRAFLQRPCRKGLNGACGFKVIADYSESFGPVILSRALTRDHRVLIRVWNSGATDWDKSNSVGIGALSVMNERQRLKTQTVWQDFRISLKATEVVIYNGHSRVGTGPGFSPFHILQTVGGVLFKYNLEKLRFTLRSSIEKPEVLMISSCESEKYYHSTLKKASPKTALALTKYEQSFGAGEQVTISLIDSLVVGRCGSGINEALQSTNGPQDGGMKIFGFD